MKTHYAAFAAFAALASGSPAHSSPSFSDGWESGIVSPSNATGSPYWGTLEAVDLTRPAGETTGGSSNRFILINDGGAREGSYYARVEVRKSDNPFIRGNIIYGLNGLLCCDNTNRAEVTSMRDANGDPILESATSGTQKISFSVKFDNSWQIISDTSPNQTTGSWGIFAQLHGPSVYSSNPIFALSATDKIRFNTRVGDIALPSQTVEHDLLNGGGELSLGKWIDFAITIKFAADSTGFVTVSRRNEGEATFTEVLSLTNTPTLQYSSDYNNGELLGDNYWKFGFYRNDQDFTSVLYLDNFVREAATSAEPTPTFIPVPPTKAPTRPIVPTSTPVSVPTATTVPSAVPTIRASPTPIATPTVAPSATSRPTPTVTIVPTQSVTTTPAITPTAVPTSRPRRFHRRFSYGR